MNPEPSITDEQVASFLADGVVVLPGVVDGAELARLRAETGDCIDALADGVPADDPHPRDVVYGEGHDSGEQVLQRVEYVVDRVASCRSLAAHPFILRTVERLVGADLVPTWDSMVLKMPGEGVAVPWHRDAATNQVGDHPIFNVDIYLDDAEADTALWALPGSHRWDDARAAAEVDARNDARHPHGFDTTGATQLCVRAGDVIVHDILVLHGSPPTAGNALRRVVYYEYRTARVETEIGPHVPAYVPRKQQVLAGCLAHRAQDAGLPPDPDPYVYAPPPPFDVFPAGDPPTYRVSHARFWRLS